MRVKRLLILFICLLCLLFASCEAATEDFSAASSADETIPDNKAASHFIQPGYASNQLHVIWDMKIWDGCLYIGAGDFVKIIRRVWQGGIASKQTSGKAAERSRTNRSEGLLSLKIN